MYMCTYTHISLPTSGVWGRRQEETKQGYTVYPDGCAHACVITRTCAHTHTYQLTSGVL